MKTLLVILLCLFTVPAYGEGTFSAHAARGLGMGSRKSPGIKKPTGFTLDKNGNVNWHTGNTGYLGDTTRVYIQQIIDNQNMVVKVQGRDKNWIVYVSGVNTDNLTNGPRFYTKSTKAFSKPLTVAGFKNYNGTTIVVLIPVGGVIPNSLKLERKK